MIDLNSFIIQLPYLEGMNVDDAEQGLRFLLPKYDIVKIRYGAPIILNFQINRIFLFYDPVTMNVVGIPTSG